MDLSGIEPEYASPQAEMPNLSGPYSFTLIVYHTSLARCLLVVACLSLQKVLLLGIIENGEERFFFPEWAIQNSNL
jgi:hypothetical protein